MRPRHAAFDIVGKHLADRAEYLAFCSTVSAESGETPKHLSTYRLSQALVDAFWSCRWSDMDMVNASAAAKQEGGFLALRYLEHGTAYNKVAQSEFYTVEASLLGVRDWFGRLLLGIGFSATPAEGYSWENVVDRQLELVRYLNGLPPSEQSEWRRWAHDNFVNHALGRAQTVFKAKLATSRPADEVISWFLPDGAPFFAHITARLADAQPMAVVRRAFPSYFASAPVSLPGTSASHASGGGAGGSKSTEGNSAGGGSAAGAKGLRSKMKEKADLPGSKSELSKVLASGHLFLASRVCDLQAVADHLKVNKEDHCWPVLFSNKKGEAALALCPEPNKHGGINSKWHKPPRGFDQAQLLKKFWSAASAEQQKEAGWRTAKRVKI